MLIAVSHEYFVNWLVIPPFDNKQFRNSGCSGVVEQLLWLTLACRMNYSEGNEKDHGQSMNTAVFYASSPMVIH